MSSRCTAPARGHVLGLARRGRAHRALPLRARAGLDEEFTSPLFNERSLFTHRRRADPSIRPEATMSARHPIISVTGSSGAGTTSVTRTFQWIFRRERIKRGVRRGRLFHRFDRAEMKREMTEARERGNQHFSHFGPDSNLFAELEELFRDLRRDGQRPHAEVPARRRGGGATRAAAGTFTPWEDVAGDRPAVLRGTAWRRGRRAGGHRASSRSPHRRGADHQPRMDPEAPSRQVARGYSTGGGRRHDPAADARLRELHLPAVLADPRQLPARPPPSTRPIRSSPATSRPPTRASS